MEDPDGYAIVSELLLGDEEVAYVSHIHDGIMTIYTTEPEFTQESHIIGVRFRVVVIDEWLASELRRLRAYDAAAWRAALTASSEGRTSGGPRADGEARDDE